MKDGDDIEMGLANALFQKTQTEYDNFNNDADAAGGVAATAKPSLNMESPSDDSEALIAQKKKLAEQENARKAKAMSDFQKDLKDLRNVTNFSPRSKMPVIANWTC